MSTRATGWVRSAAALVALVAGVFGVPLVLAAAAGWPLPTALPSFGRVRTALQQGDIPADVVLKTLAVVAWVIWLQFVWAVVWEIAVNIRRVDQSQRPLRAPMVPHVVGAGVGRLVAVALSIGTVTLNSASVAVALPGTPSSVFAPVAAEAPPAPIADAQPAASEVCWAVHEGDSLWHIAQTSLGDGSRAGDILELNPLLRSPRDVRAGQQLRLPADGIVPLDRRPESSAVRGRSDGSIDPPTYLAPAQLVIAPGDTLWELSEERLDEAMAGHVHPSDVIGYLDQVIAANADVVEDPNLIYPGEVFQMPAVGTPPTPPPTAPLPSPDAADEMAAPLPPLATDLGSPAETAPSFDPPVRSAPTIPVPDRLTPPASSSGAAPNNRDLVPTSVGSSDTPSQASTAPWLAGISGATVLSSAVLVAYRRRQRRQATRGAAAYRRAAHESTIVDSLIVAADVNLVTWAAHELGVVFDGLRPSDFVGVPLAAEISEMSGLELLWSHRNAVAPLPWEAIDGGWSWRLTYDPDRPTPADPSPHPLPALVTIGTRDGNQLLLNVEAFGSVAVTGDRTASEGLVRAIAVELGSNDLSANSFIHVVGFDNDTDAHFERLTRRAEPDAFEHARSMVASHDAVLAEADLESSFALRVGGDAVGRESTVVIADSSQLANPKGFVEFVRPCRGVALVALGELESVGATIQVMADGTATIDQLDLEFQAAQLPQETVERLSDLLDEAIEPIAVDPVDSGIAESLSEVDGKSAAGADPAGFVDLGVPGLLDIDVDADLVCETPEVLVRVLGAPTVDGFPQLGRVETNIVTFLAVKEGSATKDQLVHAVWGGRLVSDQTLFNRVAKTRAVLGEYLPARTRSSVTIDLDRRVGTDLDVLVGALQNSVALSAVQAIASLTAALDLVRGVPFDGADFDWAHEQQFVADACETLEAATLRVVKLALELGDPASARQAICQGLRALPGNEPIYRARMQIEHALGNIDGVNCALRELTSVLLGSVDDGFEFEPSIETIDLHRRLSCTEHLD